MLHQKIFHVQLTRQEYYYIWLCLYSYLCSERHAEFGARVPNGGTNSTNSSGQRMVPADWTDPRYRQGDGGLGRSAGSLLLATRCILRSGFINANSVNRLLNLN